MKVCTCTICGNILEDVNGSDISIDYPEMIEIMSLIWVEDEEYPKDPEAMFLACPICKTDSKLIDNIYFPELNEESIKNCIMAGIPIDL